MAVVVTVVDVGEVLGLEREFEVPVPCSGEDGDRVWSVMGLVDADEGLSTDRSGDALQFPGCNRRLCTDWGFEDTLEARRNCTIVRDQRWAVDVNVVSSQGVSAGIDMALWLIGQIYTPDHARGTQHYIQYEPAPPILRRHLIPAIASARCVVGRSATGLARLDDADRPPSQSSRALSPQPPNASEFR